MKITNTYKFFDTLLVTLLVFSGGGLLFVYFKDAASFFLCFLALVSCVLFGKAVRARIFNSAVITISTFSLMVLLVYFMSPLSQSFIKYGFYLLNGLICVLICIHIFNNRDTHYFINRLRVVLLYILVLSICNFIFSVLLGYARIESLPFLESEYYHAQHFKYIFFYNPEKHKYTIFGIDFIRNQGLFWEPGVHQVYLNLLLYIEGFIFRRRGWIIAIIIFAILTTFSTAGFIIMSIILISLYFNSLVNYIIKGNPIIVIFLSVFFITSSYYMGQKVILPNIINKAYGDQEKSFQKRIFDLIQCPCIAADYPLTGVGLDKEEFHEFRSSYNMTDRCKAVSDYFEEITGIDIKTRYTEKGSSNSITGLMATMGFPFSCIFLYLLFQQNLFNVRKKIFFSIIVISVFFEPLLLRPFFLILILSGMMSFFNKFTK